MRVSEWRVALYLQIHLMQPEVHGALGVLLSAGEGEGNAAPTGHDGHKFPSGALTLKVLQRDHLRSMAQWQTCVHLCPQYVHRRVRLFKMDF